MKARAWSEYLGGKWVIVMHADAEEAREIADLIPPTAGGLLPLAQDLRDAAEEADDHNNG